MKLQQIKLRDVVMAAAAMLVLVLLYTFFSKTKVAPEAHLYDQLIQAKEETIKALQGERAAWQQVAAGKDTLIATYKTETVQRLAAAGKNKIFYIENKKQYEAIPNAVRSLPVDSLQRAIESWYAGQR